MFDWTYYINRLRIKWYRFRKKQMCWQHTSYTISCLICKEIRQ